MTRLVISICSLDPQISTLWGREFEAAKMVDMAEFWAEDLTTAPIAWAGHLPHEERPAEVSAALEPFLAPWRGLTAGAESGTHLALSSSNI
jgi:hypothetical protein